MASVTRVNPTAVARGTIQYLNHQTVYKVVLNGSGLVLSVLSSSSRAQVLKFSW